MAASGDYYINRVEGTIQQQHDPVLAAALSAAGFLGPFATIADAKAAIGGKDFAGQVTSAAQSAAGSVTSGVTGFIKDLTQRALWMRVLKIAVGGALIIAGVAQLVHAQSLVSTVTKAAAVA